MKIHAMLCFLVPVLLINVGAVSAYTDCSFSFVGKNMILRNNCFTDETIYIPEGKTLYGGRHTITAVDPPGGHFTGAVVQNAGSVAHVKHLKIRGKDLSNVCDSGDDRLRGIMFEGASGSIRFCTIEGINQGSSGCQEGNAIEIRNEPFDGTHPDTKKVTVSFNIIDDYQKTGIVANGDVDVKITSTFVGSADLPYSLAANSIQLGYGAKGLVWSNTIKGNQWCGCFG